ncbi:hypothetical protein GQ42DRAFT_165997 [Ramicandelaber brevisporus]|nr:hypothetical protein GQ42DRAFT_165997 [Ramicandelaber brevisporus]
MSKNRKAVRRSSTSTASTASAPIQREPLLKQQQQQPTATRFNLFALPEELIELVMRHFSYRSLECFFYAFAQSASYYRTKYNTLVISGRRNHMALSLLCEAIPLFGRYVKHLKIFEFNDKITAIEFCISFPNAVSFVTELVSIPDSVYDMHLSRLFHLRKVTMYSTNTPAAKWLKAIEWINDDRMSGQVSTVHFVVAVQTAPELALLRSVLAKINDLWRIRLELIASLAHVSERLFPQLIPLLAKLTFDSLSSNGCFGPKLSALFGNSDVVLPHLCELSLPLCCCGNYDFAHFNQARFPRLTQLRTNFYEDKCTGIKEHEHGSVKIFSTMWPTVTSFILMTKSLSMDEIAAICKQLPNVIEFKVFAECMFDIYEITTILPRLRFLFISVPRIEYSLASLLPSVLDRQATQQLVHCHLPTATGRFLYRLSVNNIDIISSVLHIAINSLSLRVLELQDCRWNANDLRKVTRSPTAPSTLWTIILRASDQAHNGAGAIVMLVSLFAQIKSLALIDHPIDIIEKIEKRFPDLEISSHDETVII